jgi:hypothetical protein
MDKKMEFPIARPIPALTTASYIVLHPPYARQAKHTVFDFHIVLHRDRKVISSGKDGHYRPADAKRYEKGFPMDFFMVPPPLYLFASQCPVHDQADHAAQK